MTNEVRLGDIIRIDVALIRQINELPNHCTQRIRLTQIQVEPDGTKVLVLSTNLADEVQG
jgi:hypothetical protein